MTMLLRYVNPTGGTLVLDEHGRLVSGDKLVAALFASLYTDAPADEGDPAPPGVERDSYWALAFDPRGGIKGSKLWMTKYVRPVSQAAVLAEQWASDALAWMVPTLAQAIDVTATVPKPSVVRLSIIVTLSPEQRRRFRVDIDYAE